MPRRVLPFSRARETYQDLRRYSHIAGVFARHGFGDLLTRLRGRYRVSWVDRAFTKGARGLEELSVAERLRLAFEELGPTFIKLAQILSSRPDILPPDFIKELSKLQDNVAPFAFSEARTVIEEQFGRPLDDLFASFEEESVAAASLAQVHRARTISGDEVAVKVQRVGVESLIETDIRILYELAGLAERHLAESTYFEPKRVVHQFARTIRRELDFVREGRNIDRFRNYFAGSDSVYIPKVYWDLTAPRVLTTEYIRGIKISALEQLEAAGLDRKTIALNGANLILKEIFEFHFFHADPHPGNLFVLENNVIAPIDFGMTGAIEEEMAQQMGGIFIAVVEKDVDALVDLLCTIGVVDELGDRAAFRLELRDVLERYHGMPLNQIDIGAVFEELMSIIRRYRLRLPSDLAVMGRTLLVAEGVGRMLYPEFRIIEIARPYARRLLLRRFDPTRELHELSKTMAEGAAFFKRLPSDLSEILLKMRRGNWSVRIEHLGLERLIGELDRSSNRISFAVVIAALIVGSSLIFRTGVGPTLFGYPAVGLGGFLLASILGVWLLIGIMRSGRL